jgi:acyl carrier protein phosphodiesterase
MSQEQQPMKVKTTTGTTVEITLEDYISTIIDRALEQHQVKCPLNQHIIDVDKLRDKEDLHGRMSKLEWKMALVQWIGGSIGLASIAHIASTLSKVLNNVN